MNLDPDQRFWLLLLGMVAGYALLIFTNPIRASLADGLRCLGRHRNVWSILALFGFSYALFQLALRWFYFVALPEPQQPEFSWKFQWTLRDAQVRMAEAHTLGDWLAAFRDSPHYGLTKAALLDAGEMLAGVFNNVVTTFPFSALAAVLLFFNWDDHHRTLWRAMHSRFGRLGWPVHFAILTCAFAAVVKPVLFGPSLPVLNRIAPGLWVVRWSTLIDSLSFFFEYLFGVCIQIYLILIVYAWVRGLSFTHAHLLDMAIRRFSFVMRWAGVVLLVSSLLIVLPRVYALVVHFEDLPFVEKTVRYIDTIARPVLAVFLILFASMQITLTFHSETLRKALGDHLAFLRRHGWKFFWFLLIAGLHFFLLSLLNRTLIRGLGPETAPALAWNLLYPLVAAGVAGWLLASWVCLFKRCEARRVRAEKPIRTGPDLS